MLALILGAVRTRTAQVLTVLILSALAAAAAAAGPWYGLSAASRAADADVATAPADQRVLSVRQIAHTNGQPQQSLDSFAGTVRSLLPIGDGAPTLGLTQAMTVKRGAADADISVAYRDGFCTHVHLDGACPSRPGEAAISRNLSQQLAIAVGQDIVVRASPTTEPVSLRVVGRYDLIDPTGGYWSNTLFRAGNGLDPVFTTLRTYADPQLWEPTVAYDVTVPERLICGDNGYRLAGALRQVDGELSAAGLNLVNPTGTILQTVARDRSSIRTGVGVTLAEVLVLAWFAIGLAGRYTGRDRRGDAALFKLRGSTRGGMLRLAAGQHLVPLLGGVLVGAPVGVLVALGLSGRFPVRTEIALASALCGAAVAAVLVGGLLVLTAVDAMVLRQPVATLLRRVPPGRRDWRADVVDLALLAVAVAAVYQARSGGPSSGLGLLAPAMVAVAVALLLARLLARVADRAGAVAVRTGRLRFGLTAVQVSRQPGTDRVFALIVVATAMFAAAAGGFAAARTARADRAEVELGAARVLTVQADSRTALEYAVRRADPTGRYAMAAAIDRSSSPPVLALDTTRLAAVARWRPEYGPVQTLPRATAATPIPPRLPLVTGARLTVTVVNPQPRPLLLTAVLQNEATGAAVRARFGPIRRGGHTLTAPVSGCTSAPGCRFVRWELNSPQRQGGQPQQPPRGGRLTIRSLTQQDPAAEVLDTGRLTDISRWHSDLAGAALDVATDDGGLTVSTDANEMEFSVAGTAVYAVDAGLPVPIVLAGAEPAPWRLGDRSLLSLGEGATPVRVVGATGVLPVLGPAGILVDFDAGRRIAADADPRGTLQVWLADGAPPSIVEVLRRGGLTVIGDESAAARADRLADQGPAVAARFALLAGVIALLLAAAAVAVTAAVDRGPQLEQFGALRTQGLSRRIAVAGGWAGLATLVVTGLAGGVLAAAIARPVARTQAPPFIDGWRVIAPPVSLSGRTLLVAALIAMAVLGVTAWLSVRPLVRRLRGVVR
jgi:putative ABC transport system permease protein